MTAVGVLQDLVYQTRARLTGGKFLRRCSRAFVTEIKELEPIDEVFRRLSTKSARVGQCVAAFGIAMILAAPSYACTEAP